MIQNRDIVVVGLQPWDIKIGSNCKNIALELARHNRVLYVNAPVDRITRLRQRNEPGMVQRINIRKTGKNLVPIADNLWNLYPKRVIDSINWMPEGALYRAVNRRNNRRLAEDIREAMTELGFKNIILFNDSDMFRSFYLPEMLKPDTSIYYSRDNLMAVPYFFKHGRTMEPALMAGSSLVCANSEYLADLARAHNPNSFYVGQGCDLSLFDPSRGVPEMPADLAAIPRPIIGYIGAILSYRLDLPLLVELCQSKPEWSFVFVGKEDEAFAASELHQLPNVHFPGLKKEDQLPSYLAHFDVAMNPQGINGMTEGNYPRKIDEYLAMGKPVVATATKTMSMFRDYVYMGTTSAEYVDLIARALRENSAERAMRRMEFARGHTWENCVAAIAAAVEKVTTVRG